MHEVTHILRSRSFRAGAAALFLLQFLLLLWWTPLYDIDTNSFIRGGFTWDIYHNPLMNLYIAFMSKIWANVWFILAGQMAVFALAASFTVHVLFQAAGWRIAALCIAALEPVNLFYQHSLLPESFFTSFTLLSVAFLVLWLRADHGTPLALLFGAALGFAFLAKLSAMIHLALVGAMIIIPQKRVWLLRFKDAGLSLLPFVACYLFVLIGQKQINDGGLYTVEGRVRWDFSSSQYNPEELEGHSEFKHFVNHYIWSDSGLVQHRELRRELSYLGYKDCVEFKETKAYSHNEGILDCDRIFGEVAADIMEEHFWAAEKQFIADNFRFVHELSYLDYRFTPGLHYYHPEHEYTYIDSLMQVHYGYTLADKADRIPFIWKDMGFTNLYMPLLWWLGWISLLAGIWFWWRFPIRVEIPSLAALVAVAWLFHLVYISYRPRFLAPYLLLLCLLFLAELRILRQGE